MMQYEKILAIGAHPDDLEYGCFGLLLKQPPSSSIHLYVASLGSAGDPTTGPKRRSESIAAFDLVRPKSVLFRDKAGVSQDDFHIILDELTEIISRVKPDLILTLGPHDTHQEHRTIFEVTSGAARRSKASILAYGILSNTLDFKPQIFIDISEVYAQKKQALRAHQSQSERAYMKEAYLDIFHANTYASLHGLGPCEAYEIVRIFA